MRDAAGKGVDQKISAKDFREACYSASTIASTMGPVLENLKPVLEKFREDFETIVKYCNQNRIFEIAEEIVNSSDGEED